MDGHCARHRPSNGMVCFSPNMGKTWASTICGVGPRYPSAFPRKNNDGWFRWTCARDGLTARNFFSSCCHQAKGHNLLGTVATPQSTRGVRSVCSNTLASPCLVARTEYKPIVKTLGLSAAAVRSWPSPSVRLPPDVRREVVLRSCVKIRNGFFSLTFRSASC